MTNPNTELEKEIEEVLVKYGEQLVEMCIKNVESGGNAGSDSRKYVEQATTKLQQLIEKKVVEAKVEAIQELLTKAVIHGGGWGKPAKTISVNKIKNHLDHLKSTKEDK